MPNPTGKNQYTGGGGFSKKPSSHSSVKKHSASVVPAFRQAAFPTNAPHGPTKSSTYAMIPKLKSVKGKLVQAVTKAPTVSKSDIKALRTSMKYG